MSVERSVSEYWKGAKAYASMMRRINRGLSCFTNQETANKRAAICLECPFNDDPGKIQRLTDKAIMNQAGGRTTEHDAKLKHCDACSCPLRITVHLDPDFLRDTKTKQSLTKRIKRREAETGKKIHPDCWQLKLY